MEKYNSNGIIYLITDNDECVAKSSTNSENNLFKCFWCSMNFIQIKMEFVVLLSKVNICINSVSRLKCM